MCVCVCVSGWIESNKRHGAGDETEPRARRRGEERRGGKNGERRYGRKSRIDISTAFIHPRLSITTMSPLSKIQDALEELF